MQSRGCGEDAYYSALIQYPRQVVHCDTTKQFKLLIRMFALISGRPRPTRSSIIPCSFLSFPELLDVQERCWTSLESDRSFIHLPKVSSEAENSFSSIKIPSLPFILGLHTRQVIHDSTTKETKQNLYFDFDKTCGHAPPREPHEVSAFFFAQFYTSFPNFSIEANITRTKHSMFIH